MGPLKTLCGLVVAMLVLSGCGGSSDSGSGSPLASGTTTPPGATEASGSNPPPSNPSPTPPPPSNPSPTPPPPVLPPPPPSHPTPPPPSPPPPSPPPPSPPPPITGSATLKWTAPTANSDGTALTDLAGYHVYYGTSPGSMTNEVDISSPGTLSYVVTNLAAGTWYFAIAAYTNTGLESPLSNVGSKTIS